MGMAVCDALFAFGLAVIVHQAIGVHSTRVETRRLSAVCSHGLGVKGGCQLKEGHAEGADAWGEFEDSVESIGYAMLRVSGRNCSDDEDARRVSYAAGVVEGALTATRTAQFFNTSWAAEFGEAPELWKRAETFVEENDAYVQSRIAEHGGNSSYWTHVSFIWAQLDGLLEGHRLAVVGGARAANLNRTAFLFMNALVDLSSVVEKPFSTLRPSGLPNDISTWTPAEAAIVADSQTHCSAIVKVAADMSELWTAHNTWTGFFSMLRVAKLYDLPMPGSSARRSAFPGYFGTLSSNDDLFVLSSGLVVQETTNAVFPPLKSQCTPRSVLTWARTILANRLAHTGKEWTQWFASENSGTINNQWMVVDYNLFTPFKPLRDGTLWVLEQLPGYIESADLTSYLRVGHWPSYNQPFFPKVRNMSGNNEMTARFGLQYSYDLNPRAKIFRRDASKIETREALKKFMRYNNWQSDPLSAAGYGGSKEPRSPENAIAARNDLIKRDSPIPEQAALRGTHGNTDAKLVGHGDVPLMKFDFVVGPTHDDQPPFSWTGEWASAAHEGHPSSFNFSWHSVDFSRWDEYTVPFTHPEYV